MSLQPDALKKRHLPIHSIKWYEQFKCSEDQVTAKGRKNNKAREVAIYLCRDMSGLSCKDLGLYFGGVSGALITIMHKRIAEESAQNRGLKRRIDAIKKRIFNI